MQYTVLRILSLAMNIQELVLQVKLLVNYRLNFILWPLQLQRKSILHIRLTVTEFIADKLYKPSTYNTFSKTSNQWQNRVRLTQAKPADLENLEKKYYLSPKMRCIL